MEPQPKELNQKRKCDENSSEQSKRKKNEAPEEAVAVTQFTDVIDDCLEHIFKHLSLSDLISLGDTCKRFQPLVESIFKTKFKGNVVDLRPGYNSNPQHLINPFENTIEIFDLSHCFKVLRLFGCKISKLNIDFFYLNADHIAKLAKYMNEFCADSLIDIKIRITSSVMMENLVKPFSNAESVDIWVCDLDDLNIWFPKMRRLVLRPDLHPCMENTFPHLEELAICARVLEKQKTYVGKLLCMNPHLQKICSNAD